MQSSFAVPHQMLHNQHLLFQNTLNKQKNKKRFQRLPESLFLCSDEVILLDKQHRIYINCRTHPVVTAYSKIFKPSKMQVRLFVHAGDFLPVGIYMSSVHLLPS